MTKNLNDLPDDLPIPIDDGKTNHLLGMQIPDLELYSTTDEWVRLSHIFLGKSVLFIYPRAGSPLEVNSFPELWDSTPGARGCTPQSCGFRDLEAEFSQIGYKIYGLSMQSSEVQKEFVQRNKMPFSILSDSEYKFTDALSLPTFIFDGDRLIKRMALVINDNKIIKVFYPVFPPNKNAEQVLHWLNGL